MTADDVRNLRVAIVHERITEYAGSERCVEQLHQIWPAATVHVAIVEHAVVPVGLRDARIEPTSLQRFYRGGGRYQHLLPLLPAAMRGIDVGDVDLVVTSHHAFSNRVRPRAGIPVVSYTHTPARWLWEPAMLDNEIGGPIGRAGLREFARWQRGPDRAAAQRLSHVIANSQYVADRVQRWWGRSAEVVHPPVDVDFFSPDPTVPREDFFLLAGRLVPYKRPEVAAAAAARAGVRLVVAGDGRARAAVEAMAPPGTEFLGPVDADTLRDLYRRCRALLFPGVEDFGIVPVEAQACGAPVIARRVGGVLDSVVDGVTGCLYDGDDVSALAVALNAFDSGRFETDTIRANAERFAPERFRDDLISSTGRVLMGRAVS